MVRVMNSPKTSVGSDHDGIRVQANAAEALVNCTRNDSHENAERIRQAGIKPLVLLCTSRNLSVQRSAALILGNIAQNDRNRIEIGSKGGIDALFILVDDPQSQAITKGVTTIETQSFPTHEQLIQRLREVIQPGDRILFKASNSVGLNRVVEAVLQQLTTND